MIFELDADQQAIVNALTGVYICLAGPGSGKTKIVVARYLNLLMHGISEKDILSLTFTAEAAAEMAKRSGVVDAKNVFRTFHSFVLDLMQKEREHVPFKMIPSILPWEFQDYELRQELARTYPVIGKADALKDYIESQKNQAITPEQAAARASGVEYFYALAYRDYERRCREEGWLDFGSLMDEAVKLLEMNEQVRNRHKRKYIQVDEFQDTDLIQVKLLTLIFDGNLLVVGDSGQALYEWRGAHPDIMAQVPQYFPGAKTMYLGTNYRSTGALVEMVKQITPVDNGLASHMRTSNPYGEKPTFTKYGDDYEEAVKVLEKVTDPANTAIIARTNRQLFRFQQVCFGKGIQCKVLGKKDFWEQSEVKKLLALAKGTRFPESYTVPMILKALTIQHRLLEKYRWSGNPLDPDPADNLESLYKLAGKHKTVEELLDNIRRITYGKRGATTKALTLATAHQAKGREFDHVFAVGLTEGILPHSKSNHIEEKRVWFVIVSRAAKKLHVSFYRNPSMFLNDYKDQIVEYRRDTDGVPLSQ
ncbi:MAG: ATP-dependent helicase [Candidatus Dormibacteria bacterium]